jgi:hypothetical protein
MRRVNAPVRRLASGPVADGLEVTEAIQYAKFQIRIAAPDRVTESDKPSGAGAPRRWSFRAPSASYGCASFFNCSISFCSIWRIRALRLKR